MLQALRLFYRKTINVMKQQKFENLIMRKKYFLFPFILFYMRQNFTLVVQPNLNVCVCEIPSQNSPWLPHTLQALILVKWPSCQGCAIVLFPSLIQSCKGYTSKFKLISLKFYHRYSIPHRYSINEQKHKRVLS